MIHTSTSEVYGTALKVPINEKHPINAQSPYAATKVAADQLVQSFQCSYNMPITTLRPFNTYGPRQSARAIIPTIITQINTGNKSIKLGSLNPTRDFNYVEDTVEAFIMSMNCEKCVGKTLNIGSNFEVSIKKTFNLIKNIMNADIEVIQDEERIRPKNSEVERLYSDNSLLKKFCVGNQNFLEKKVLKRITKNY